MWFYADEETRRTLDSGAPVVLLYGGYEGFDNYGDILQLQGAIAFHRRMGMREPVLVLSLAAWTHQGLLEHVRSVFGVRGVVLEDGERLDASSVGLEVVTSVTEGALLHVYGGGYFCGPWAKRRVWVCEQILFRLHVGGFVVSGVQVDEVGARELARLFALRTPDVIAVRDEMSRAALLAHNPAIEPEFSFDDAVEAIEALMQATAAESAAGGDVRRTIGIHLNLTSEYIEPEHAELARNAVTQSWAAYPHHGTVLLAAYNDLRPLVEDTVASAEILGLATELIDFEVVNLATMASAGDLAGHRRARLAAVLASMEFVISSSYHVALTCSLMGVPTFLLASSDYYGVKRRALGLPDELDAFLRDPGLARDFASERRARGEWLMQLEDVCSASPHAGHAREVLLPEWKSAEQLDTLQETYFVRPA
jgi:hypothetical protein